MTKYQFEGQIISILSEIHSLTKIVVGPRGSFSKFRLLQFSIDNAVDLKIGQHVSISMEIQE